MQPWSKTSHIDSVQKTFIQDSLAVSREIDVSVEHAASNLATVLDTFPNAFVVAAVCGSASDVGAVQHAVAFLKGELCFPISISLSIIVSVELLFHRLLLK